MTNAPLPSFLVLLLSTMLFGMEYLLGQLESSVLALSSPSLLLTPSLLAFRGVGGCWRDSLDAVGAKTLVCDTDIFLATGTKHSTVLWEG